MSLLLIFIIIITHFFKASGETTVTSQSTTSIETTPPTGLYPHNIASYGNASQHNPYNYLGFIWEAEFAIDGNKDGSAPETSRTCSSTQDNGAETNFWGVEFDQEYNIMKMIIYGRTNIGANLDGFSVHAENVTGSSLYTNTVYGNGTIEINLEPEVTLNSVVITRDGQQFIELCEVEVYEACPYGVYGTACTEVCGNCWQNEACYKVTGICPNGCEAGWNGTLCMDVCPLGMHGPNCQETCGNCQGGAPCDKYNGTCPGSCEPGYLNHDCKQPCPPGNYGTGCNSTCGNCFQGEACDIISGLCTSGCDAGYQGALCENECYNQTYGQKCSGTCGQCLADDTCDHVTGHCSSGCKPSFIPPFCAEQVSTVSTGPTIPITIQSTPSTRGTSVTGTSSPVSTSTKVSTTTESSDDPDLALIIGAAGGGVVFILIVAIVAVLINKSKGKVRKFRSNGVHANDLYLNESAPMPKKTSYANR